MMIVDLNGTWVLQRHGSHDQVEAQVPGCVHTDLLAAGLIADPFVGENEEAMRWIFHDRWIYRRDFDVPAGFLSRSRILLCCEGLDTVSHLVLNGKPLGTTDNMFRRWEFDVKPFLLPGSNQIEIQFDSPLEYIEARQKIRPITYPTAPHQVPAFSQIRKAAFSFGWDWGPCLPTSGIWRPIYLRAFDTGRLLDVSIRQDHVDAQRVKLAVCVQTENESDAALTSRVTLKYGSDVIDSESCLIVGSEGGIELCIEAPHLWWPRGMGEQPLYEITVELLDESSHVLDVRERRIGLRTLRLDCSPDQWGSAFSFSANGIPFFAKGSNWIPADALVTRVSSGTLRNRLEAAADVHMNMIRVWGGGIYEPDEFYDLCDELGLCVWQDFMFACAPYPLEVPEFVENVEIEIRQQIRRLRHHACLALWCGNNELEMCGFVAETADAMHMALADYRAFFSERIPALLAEDAPEQCYWPGSPYKEPGDVYNPDFWIDSPGRGDAHIWGVWHSEQPIEAYRESHHRFLSEFGFHGFPGPDTVRRFAGPDDMRLDSPVMRHHQREHEGNARLMRFLLSWFRMPRDFEATLWCSQILQGLALQYACEHWRRSMPRTMGTLYWQLNDTWPVTSCATIDYFGQWKAAHYLAKRFFAPLMGSAIVNPDSGEVQVHVTSDLAQPAECSLRWRLTDLAGRSLRDGERRVSAPPRANTKCEVLEFRSEIQQHGPQNLLLWLDLRNGNERASRDLVCFAKPKELDLLDPELSCTVEPTGEGAFRATVIAKKPALWAWLQLPGHRLHCSENFVHIHPGTPMDTLVRPDPPMDLAGFEKNLRLRSLFDTYDSQPTEKILI